MESTSHLLLNALFSPFLFVLVSHTSLLKIGHILSGYYNSNCFPCTVGQRAGERWLTYCSAKAWEKPLQNISDMDQPNHVPVGHILYVISWRKRRPAGSCIRLAAEVLLLNLPVRFVCLVFFLCVWTLFYSDCDIVNSESNDAGWLGVTWCEMVSMLEQLRRI